MCRRPGPIHAAQLWLPEYAGYFAAGMALAVVAARTAEPPALARRPWLCWGVALGAYVLVSTPLTGSTLRYPTVGQALLEHALYLVVAVGLVVPLALGPARPERATPAGLLSRPLPAWLGQISYGLFLWHMVVVEAWLRTTGERAYRRTSWCSSRSPWCSPSDVPRSATTWSNGRCVGCAAGRRCRAGARRRPGLPQPEIRHEQEYVRP